MMATVDGTEQHGDICSEENLSGSQSVSQDPVKPGSWLGPPENSDLNFSTSLGASVSLSLFFCTIRELDGVICFVLFVIYKDSFSSKILNLDRALL